MLLRAVVIWMALVFLAVVNGAARSVLVAPRLGDYAGHLISTAIFCGVIILVTWLTIGWMEPRSLRGAWLIGAMWLALTVAFEFLAGHYLFGNAWAKLIADYNLLRGRVWVLVLCATLLAPVWVRWKRRVA